MQSYNNNLNEKNNLFDELEAVSSLLKTFWLLGN